MKTLSRFICLIAYSHLIKTTIMNHRLAFVFFLVSLTGFSQQDLLVITTDLSVDSISVSNRKPDFSQLNDTLIQMKVDRHKDSTDDRLIIYSEKKTYETNLPTDPATAFPAEWSVRDPHYPVTIRMSVKKGQWVLMTADGSAVNMLSSLTVYGPSGDFIPEESYGVHLIGMRKKKRNSKK